MDGNILLTIGPDGEAELYDDTYDITIHCTNQQEHDRAIKMMEAANRMKWQTGKPTESGDYLVKYMAGNGRIKVDVEHYSAKSGNWYWHHSHRIIKWCPIPADEEDEA